MQIKDLFSKLIKDPTTRKDAEQLLSGKIKILFEEAIDERGKPYEKLTPVGAITKEDIASFRKFNSTNIRKNVADSLYKFYKQKQKDLYKQYVEQIKKAVSFYDNELNKLYGAGFAEQFSSLKEKEDAFSRMKFFSLQTSSVGKLQLDEISSIKKSADYEKNKKKYEERIKMLQEQYQMLKRAEFSSKKSEPFNKENFSKNFSNYREENNIIISLIEKISEQNNNTIFSMVEDSIGRLHEIENMIKTSGMSNTNKNAFSKKIASLKGNLSTSSEKMDYSSIISNAMSSIETMATIKTQIDEQKKILRSSKNSEIEKAKEELKKRKAAVNTKNAMDAKIAAGETVDSSEYAAVSKLANKGSITKLTNRITKMEKEHNLLVEESIKTYDIMLDRIMEFQNLINEKPLTSSVENTNIRGENGKRDISISQVNDGNLTETAELTQKQLDLISQISEENNRLQNIEENIKQSSEIPDIENRLNDMNLRTGKIEGSVTSPSEYIEHMMRDFGSYMLRIRLVQRGLQDITDAIGEFQKVDDAAFQLGMVSDLNIGTIRAYRNEILGLAADYRTTAEEIINTQSEVIKSGRTFDQAKQQVSASLILARSTFEDLNSASDVLNKLMLTLEISGSKSYETMTKLYNVVQNTPASLAGMEASMRQSSAAFSGLLDEIDYSGAQLDAYKDELRDAELSLIGFVNLQGKTPQMAGTAIKTLVDKMRAPTDKAVSQINSDLSKTGATYKGESVTSAMISRLAETDFNEGIDLLSKLYVNGNLTYKAIQDMFGPRNAATLSKLLYQVNGDLVGNSDDMLNKYNPLKDSEKLSQSWSQEMEELKNSFRALKGVANDFGDALLPLINVTGEAVQGIAKFANEDTFAKSALQSGAMTYSAGKVATDVMLSTYAMAQANVRNTDAENQDMAVIGKIFRDITKNGDIKANLIEMSQKFKDMGRAMYSVIATPFGAWILGITAALTLLNYAIKTHSEALAKADQAYINSSKSIEIIDSSSRSYLDSLKDIEKTMESLDPTAFKTSNSIQILSSEIKNMLDMTMDYTGKLSSFTKNLQLDEQLKEVNQTLNNPNASKADLEKAEKQRLIIERAKRLDFSEVEIENIKERTEIFRAGKRLKKAEEVSLLYRLTGKALWSEEKDWQREERITAESELQKALGKNLSKEDVAKISDAKYKKSNLENKTSVTNPIYTLFEELKNKTIGKDEKILTENLGEIDLADYDTAQLDEAMIEAYSRYMDARSKNMESIMTSLAKEASQTSDINNFLGTRIKEKQASIFKNSGNMISAEDRMKYLKKDKVIRELIESSKNEDELFKKISEVSSESAIDYLEMESVIKKNNELAQSKIDKFDYLKVRKNPEGNKVIGSSKNINKITSEIITSKDSVTGKTFEEMYKISRSEMLDIVKRTKRYSYIDNDGNKAMKTDLKKNIEKALSDIGESLNKDMIKAIEDISNNNLGYLEHDLEKGTLLSSLGITDIDNFEQIKSAMKNGKLKDDIEAQISILINTANDEIATYLAKMLDLKGLPIGDYLSVRNSKKIIEDNKILSALNESQRAMDALVMAYKTKISNIAVSLTSAQNRMESMGDVNFISNSSNLAKLKRESFIASKKADLIATFPAPNRSQTDIDMERDAKTRQILYKKYGKSDIYEKDKNNTNGEWQAAAKEAIEELDKIARDKIEKRVDSIINSAMSAVTEEGTKNEKAYQKIINANAKDNSFITFLNETIDAYMGVQKTIREALAIDQEDFRKARQAAEQKVRNISNNDKYIKFEGATGAATSGTGIMKTMLEYTGKINTALEDASIKLTTKDKDGKPIHNYPQIYDYSKESVLKAFDAIEELKKTNPILASAQKKWLEEIVNAKEEERKASSELIEQLRKFKNELITDIYKINRETGKGNTYGEYSLESYFTNLETISNKYSELETELSGKKYWYETNKEGVTTIKGINMENANKLFNEIVEKQRENAVTESKMNAYVNTLVQSQKELGYRTSARTFERAINSTQAKTPEGIFQQNESLFETRVGKANAWMNVYNDILSSASSIPSIQKKIAENQVIILQNTQKELKVKYDSLNSVADLVEINKIGVQIAMQMIEKQKQELQLKIDSLENQKKINSLYSERRELTGQNVSPTDKLNESLKIAYDQMMISIQQLEMEEKLKNEMEAQINSMASLEEAIRIDTASRDATEGRKYIGKSLSYDTESTKNYKAMENYLKKHKKNKVDGTNDEFAASNNVDNISNDESAVSNIIEVNKESIEASVEQGKSVKARLIVEQYINDVYKARLEYAKGIDSKYGNAMDNFSAIITGNFDKIKADVPTLRNSILPLIASYTSKNTPDRNLVKDASFGMLKQYRGDKTLISDSSVGKYLGKDFFDKNTEKLKEIEKYNGLNDAEKKKMLLEKRQTESEFLYIPDLNTAGEAAQDKDNQDAFKKSIYNSLIAVTDTVFQAINSATIKEAKAKLEGLQFEEKILNERKAGYRTELAKRQIEDKIYENKMKQIDEQYKIDKATTGSQIGGTISGIGSAIGLIKPMAVAGAVTMIAGPILGSILAEADIDSKMKEAQAKADLVSEKNYKEYNDFWTLFFNTIRSITDMASQRISSLTEDYSSGRNKQRLMAGVKIQEDTNKAAIDSMNDFQGLGSVTERYKVKTWDGKNKKKKITTDLNYSFDDLSLEDMKNYASMSPEQLKELMVAEMKKDNSYKSGTHEGGVLWMKAKYQGTDWEVLDSDVTDFQESLIEAVNAIEYLSREVGSLADKIFYADKEGYASDKESDVNSRYSELVANAKAAGNDTLAKNLQDEWDRETEKFKKAGKDGKSEIFYSIFSTIIMDGAKKVAKDTGKFSTAWAAGVGEAYGTQFRNVISEVMNKAVPDNAKVDTYMENFGNKLKDYNGDLSQYINKDGVLDIDELSKGVGAGSMVDALAGTSDGTMVGAANGLNELQSINFYNTSKTLAEQLRNRGLSENQIATALESANLIDPLKVAVEKLSDVFNPLGISSANLAMQRESFEANNSERRSELNRKKILGTASTEELTELKGIETEDMKLSIKENVIEGFASGLKNVAKDTKYTSIFETFGSTIGESISSRMLADMDISEKSSAIAEMIANGDYTNASKAVSDLSLTMLSSNKKNLKIVQELRDSGLDWSEIDALGLTENIYSKVEDIIKENSSLSKTIAKYAKDLIDYNNIMVNDKYTNEEYYTELAKRASRGEELSKSESQWMKSYTEGLDTIISKQTLINSLESNFQSMLSESSSVSVLKGIGASIGSIYKEMIIKGIDANNVMESLVENVMSGKSINKQLSDISSIFQSAKNQQDLLKRQMIAQGSSYTMTEAIFGEDYTSTIANIYGEMKTYSNALADISRKQEEYKRALASVNGITYTYEEYYRELNLKKANGIKLTAEEIKWTEKYSDTIKEFETNTSIVNSFYSAVSTAFSKESSYEMFGSFADGFSEILSEKIIDGYLTNEFVDDMDSAISLAQRALSTGSVKDLYSAQQQLIAFSTEVETAKNQTQGLLDMFNSSKLIDFTDKTNDVQYSASSSKDITYNITQNLTLSAGNIIADGFELSKLAKVLAPLLKPELKKV